MKIVVEGVYFLYDGDELVYIGQSNNVMMRIGEHIKEGVKEFDRFEFYPTVDKTRLEGFLIQMFKPKYNYSMGSSQALWGTFGDKFIGMEIEEAIKKYDECAKDPTVERIAKDLSLNKRDLLYTLKKIKAPVYKIDDYFRIDRKWIDARREEVIKAYWEL